MHLHTQLNCDTMHLKHIRHLHGCALEPLLFEQYMGSVKLIALNKT